MPSKDSKSAALPQCVHGYTGYCCICLQGGSTLGAAPSTFTLRCGHCGFQPADQAALGEICMVCGGDGYRLRAESPRTPPLDAGGATADQLRAQLAAIHSWRLSADLTPGQDAALAVLAALPAPEGTGALDPKRSLTCNQCRRFVCNSEFDRIVYCDATCESAWKREHGWADVPAGDLPGVGPQDEPPFCHADWCDADDDGPCTCGHTQMRAYAARLRLQAAAGEQATGRILSITSTESAQTFSEATDWREEYSRLLKSIHTIGSP